MEELWKLWYYDGKPTRYEISNNGQIHDIKTNKYTYGNKNKEGYMKYTFYLNDHTPVSKLVHRLVAELFVYNPNKEYTIIDHINSIKNDNRAENLRWCTNEMNINYAKEKGAMAKGKGENSPRHKYSKNDISKVIAMLLSGEYTIKEISQITNVHKRTISDLKNGKIWTDDTSGLVFSVKNGIRKFTDDQIKTVISLLNGEYTIKQISDITGVTKNVIREIYKRNIYTRFTDNIENLSYKAISKRADIETIKTAISLLETNNYTRSEISRITNLSRSIIEKLAYHQRWVNLTKGKKLGFKHSKKK